MYKPLCVCLCVSVRCSRQHRGEDAAAGVCPEQEESAGSAKPKPLSAQRPALLVWVSVTAHHHKTAFSGLGCERL